MALRCRTHCGACQVFTALGGASAHAGIVLQRREQACVRCRVCVSQQPRVVSCACERDHRDHL